MNKETKSKNVFKNAKGKKQNMPLEGEMRDKVKSIVDAVNKKRGK